MAIPDYVNMFLHEDILDKYLIEGQTDAGQPDSHSLPEVATPQPSQPSAQTQEGVVTAKPVKVTKPRAKAVSTCVFVRVVVILGQFVRYFMETKD